MASENPPPTRRIVGEFSTDPGRLARALGYRGLILFGFASALFGTIGILLLLSGSWTLEAGGAAVAVGVAAVGIGAWREIRAARLRGPQHLRLTDWGVELDAEPLRPGPRERSSGGALPWSRVGNVESVTLGALGRAGVAVVKFDSIEHVRYPSESLPADGTWMIRVSGVRIEDAQAILKIAADRRVRVNRGPL